MTTDLTWPREGLPEVADTPTAFARAAVELDAGIGPIAIDTERASGFRYDDRAFLLQLRRNGTGTLLIAPEGHRQAVTEAFAGVLNSAEWVLHAAASDLPSLAMLGFRPARLFDTELAGRLAGVERVNLAAMIEHFFGYRLAKGHGAEDWSAHPLPEEWLAYAALDVELLLELAEAMAELLDQQGKLEFAEQEFAYLLDAYSVAPAPVTWRDIKGVGSLRRPEQLNVARHLWETREDLAVAEDRAVSRILANKVLVEIARTLPTDRRDLSSIRGFPYRHPYATRFWFEELVQARRVPAERWPEPLPRRAAVPSRPLWQKEFPDSWEVYAEIREELGALTEDTGIPLENLLRPAVVREAVWAATETAEISSPVQLREWLRQHDARPWQIELISPLLVASIRRHGTF